MGMRPGGLAHGSPGSGRRQEQRQGLEDPQSDGATPAQLLLGHGELHLGEAPHQVLERDGALQPRQRRPTSRFQPGMAAM
ncbi:hypothetical protein [Archangium lipolyticum]|uniref:hypothetical protein n=1 Tax=Archangium lipolyticum TaxID=2970465 RepID=UPI00214A2421|nr:hypothetical protein [Archangium lipolyticum]